MPSPSPFAGDAWLDASAVWRRSSDRRSEQETRLTGTAATSVGAAGCGSKDVEDGCASGPGGYYRDGVVTTGVSESCVGWFRRSGGVWALSPGGVGVGGGGGGDGDGGGPWEAFSAREVRREVEQQEYVGFLRETAFAAPLRLSLVGSNDTFVVQTVDTFEGLNA